MEKFLPVNISIFMFMRSNNRNKRSIYTIKNARKSCNWVKVAFNLFLFLPFPEHINNLGALRTTHSMKAAKVLLTVGCNTIKKSFEQF